MRLLLFVLTHLIPTKSRLPVEMSACIGVPSGGADSGACWQTVKPSLILTGIPFGLSLSKPAAARPSVGSGRMQVKSRGNHRLRLSVPYAVAGFTLLELLVVIAVMGILATVAVMAYDGVQEQSRYDATRFEMAEIRKALLQFRRDSGTNDFPGQGQYDCDDDPDGDSNTLNLELVFPSEAGNSDPDKIAWCKSAANFWMLFVDPLGRGWNQDTHRGWRGPYLQKKEAPVNGVWVVTDAYGSPFEFELDTGGSADDRIVSAGPDRSKASPAADLCQPQAGADDMVLCLRR